MSAMEKHVVQIFDRTKRIIEQARQECYLWEHHLFPKLLLNGIPPPPWLCNSSLHSLPSDPKESNNDDLVSGVLLSQPQFRVPFPGHHGSLYSNLDVVSDDVRYPIGLHNEVRAFNKKDCDTGDRLSNLPDCSVNNDGCASSGPSKLDSGAVSPQNQIEPRVSDSYPDPALSLAKLQRSKSRQRALELRNSAKAPKRLSGDDNNTDDYAATFTGSASSTLQEDHIKESDLVKDFHPNIQSSMEEVRRGDCLTQKDHKSNYSGHLTRSKSLSQKFNSLNAGSSSVVKEDGAPPNNLNEALELVNQPWFIDRSCGVQEANTVESQSKEAGNSVYDKRLTKPRSSSQARHNSEFLKLDSTSGRDKGVEVSDLKQPYTNVESTDLSKASDCNNGSRRNTVEDGDFCQTKQEHNIQGRIRLLRSSCPSPGNDFLMTGGSVKSFNKSVQSPQPLISKNSQDPSVSVVGSFSSQKNNDICAVNTKDRLSRSGSGKAYLTRDSKLSKSLNPNLCDQRATCSEFAGKKSQDVQPTDDARRLSSSPMYSKLDIEIAMDSAEKENIAALAASRNTGAVDSCTNEGSLRPASSSNLDGGSLPEESLYIKTVVAEKVLDVQENILSGANPADNAEHRSAATVAKVHADFDGLVEKEPSCLGSRLTIVNPKDGLDVSVLKPPSDFVISLMPKQLDFDDVEETSMNEICSPDLKEGQQGMSPEKGLLNLLEPLKLSDEETQEVLIREEGYQMKNHASHFKEPDTAREALDAMSLNKELPMVQKELCILTSSLMNNSSPSQVGAENSSGNLSKEAMASGVVSTSNKLENDESGTKLADSFSAAVTENGLHKYTDESVRNFTVAFPFAAPMDEVNVRLIQQAPSTISLCQNGDLLRQALLSDEKITGFSTDVQIFNSSTESFTYDVEHSCPQHKRRKIEIETEKFLPDGTNFLQKPLDSIDQRLASRTLSIEQDNTEAVLEVQHLAPDQQDDTGLEYVSISNSPTDVMRDAGECQKMGGSSHKVRKEEKLILEGSGISSDTLMLAEANLSSFTVDSKMRCNMDEKVVPWHLQVNSGQDSAEHLTCVERSTSSRCLDLISTGEALPEFEGFIMQTDAQPCTSGDQMELENMNLPSNSVDYTSRGRSRFMRSPFCYSSTPYKPHTLPNYQSVPNGLLEGYGLRTSLPLNDGSPRALSDCLPKCEGQYSVQTIWDRINSNLGSSGKRKTLKLELPCINEENENVDEIAGTFQEGIVSEGMTGSIAREPLAEITDNAKASTSVLQDDVLTGGREDFVSTEFDFGGTHNIVKKKLDKQDRHRTRFTSKGKENQSISLGANGAQRTSESVRKRSSRPKLSGKDSMKQGRPTYSEVKSTCKNIVSNVTSFIPLVQQKQVAAVFTGKRDIKVKALEAAEAAKRVAEKKENERKMKKEALKLERERLEQRNLRQLELQKKKKEEERKKKEADMAAKKRQREDEEKKEKERKRRRVNDLKQQQQQEHEKIHAKKEEIQMQCRATGEKIHESRKFMDERDNCNNFEFELQDNREGNGEKMSETEPLTIRDSANDKTKESCLEYSESVNDCANNGKVTGNLIKATEDDDLIIKKSLQEQSYEISPYRGSDDEDEDDDDVSNKKFIPSWASKHRLSLIVSSQKMDPETIFPPQSFCNITEVLLPRKLQL